jgi:ketosteroid isomerase-like protein
LAFEINVNGKLLLIWVAALWAANGAYAGGRYQRAEDGEARVWSNFPRSGYEVTWEGDRDAKGYAKGYGRVTWYKLEREIEMGSLIPTAKRTLVVRYSGKMTRGKLEGAVTSPGPNGEIFHAKFVDGNIRGDWIAGPAPGRDQKHNDEVIHRAELVEAPAEGPRQVPGESADHAGQAVTMVETPTQGSDSLRSLTAPPSSLRLGIVNETRPSTPPPQPFEPDDAKTVATLDTQYQAAVKANDAATMDRILADDFVLVTGRGRVCSKMDLIRQARQRETIYDHQEEEEGTQKVRVWGDTAVVTARLWVKGTEQGTPVDERLWFSDTYVRTPSGWRYVFGQASIPLPKVEAQYGVSD